MNQNPTVRSPDGGKSNQQVIAPAGAPHDQPSGMIRLHHIGQCQGKQDPTGSISRGLVMPRPPEGGSGA